MVSTKKISLPSLSMFSRTPVYDVNGTLVLGLQQPVVIPDSSDQIYSVRSGTANRLDKISYIFYGTSRLWWAVAQINNLVDPLLDLPIGTKLRIPNRSRLPVA